MGNKFVSRMENTEEEKQFLNSISKYSLKFNSREFERGFQIFHHSKVTKNIKRIALGGLILFLIWMPPSTYAYFKYKDDENTNNQTKIYNTFWFAFAFIYLSFPLFDYIFAKYLPNIRKFRGFMCTAVLYIMAIGMGVVDPTQEYYQY